jgi:hypothetical protein
MSLIKTTAINGLTVPDACYKILSLSYKESTRTANISVGVFATFEVSKIHNYTPLTLLHFAIPEWDKSTPDPAFVAAYLWLASQPELAGCTPDPDELPPAEPEPTPEEPTPDGYVN